MGEVAGSAINMTGVRRRAGNSGPTLLDDIELRVDRGAMVHIVGPSGSGKTSLLRLINRLDEASAGRIEVLGRPLETWPVRELRRRVAMVFQEPSLLGRSVRENLALPFELCGEQPPDLEPRMRAVLRQAGLSEELLERRGSELSVGQKQRATLARALITEPEILLLDEPTSSLDPRTAEGLLERLEAARQDRRLTVVMVTHRLEEARRLGGRMAVLIAGRIAAEASVESLLSAPPTAAVQAFLQGPQP